jgi:hypothetical protein
MTPKLVEHLLCEPEDNGILRIKWHQPVLGAKAGQGCAVLGWSLPGSGENSVQLLPQSVVAA